jgi:hypothetical protein
MEILALSITGTLGMLLAQLVELSRPWLEERVIVRVPPRATGSSRVSTSPLTLKKAA